MVLFPWVPTFAEEPARAELQQPRTEQGAQDRPAEPPTLAKPRWAAGDPKRAKQLDKVRKEGDQWQAQLDARRAADSHVQAQLEQARRAVAGWQGLPTTPRHAEELERTREEVDALEARLASQEAQKREAAIRLRHAQRRLADLERPVHSPSLTPASWAEALFANRTKDFGQV